MNRWVVKLALCGLLFVCEITFSQNIDWQSDLETATQIAERENKLILLHFSADWCRPCKELETFVFASERVVKTMSERVVAVEINTDHHKDLVKEFSVGEIPMDVVITPKGRVISKRKSPKSADDYQRMVASLPPVEVAQKHANLDITKKIDQVLAAANSSNQPLEAKPRTDMLEPTAPQHFRPAASIESTELESKTVSKARLVDHETVNEFSPRPSKQFSSNANQAQAPAALRVINDKFFAEKSNALDQPTARPAVAMPPQQPIAPQQVAMPQQVELPVQPTAPQQRIAKALSRPVQTTEEVIRQPMTSQTTGDNSFRAPSFVEPIRQQTTIQPQLQIQQPALTTSTTKPITSSPPRQLAEATIDNPFRSAQQVDTSREGRSAARILEPNFNQKKLELDANQTTQRTVHRVAQTAPVERMATMSIETGQTLDNKLPVRSPQVVTRNQPQIVTEQQTTASNQAIERQPTNKLLTKLQNSVETPMVKAKKQTEPTEVFVLNGKCPVTLIRDGKWEQGKRQFGCVHRGRVYLFSSQENLDVFQASPETFSPILAGYDPVIFHEDGELVDGNEKHGVFMGKSPNHRIVLFQSAETRAKFQASPKTFMTTIKTAVRKSDKKIR